MHCAATCDVAFPHRSRTSPPHPPTASMTASFTCEQPQQGLFSCCCSCCFVALKNIPVSLPSTCTFFRLSVNTDQTHGAGRLPWSHGKTCCFSCINQLKTIKRLYRHRAPCRGNDRQRQARTPRGHRATGTSRLHRGVDRHHQQRREKSRMLRRLKLQGTFSSRTWEPARNREKLNHRSLPALLYRVRTPTQVDIRVETLVEVESRKKTLSDKKARGTWRRKATNTGQLGVVVKLKRLTRATVWRCFDDRA